MYPGDISGHTESNVNIRCNSVAFVPRCGVMNHGENFEIGILRFRLRGNLPRIRGIITIARCARMFGGTRTR